VYPNAATELRVKSLGDGRLSGHVIFYGPRGTAKTTTANLLAKTIGGQNAHIESNFEKLMAMPDLMFYLKQGCHFAKLFTSSKFFLLFNEFDNYKGTPYQLWDAMDLLQSEGLMLIITTNDLMAIHPSIRSRCRLIEFPAITASAMLPRAQQILSAEGLALPDAQALSYLKGQERFGDLRKYADLIDELLLIQKSELAMPPWSGQKPSLKVI
jgi:DNA polymerase III delta prime subunit